MSWTWTPSMDLDRYRGHGQRAWTPTSNVDFGMHHWQVHSACPHVHTAFPCHIVRPYPYCMFMPKMFKWFTLECQNAPWNMDMDKQQTWTQHGQVHAACPCPGWCPKYMLCVHNHATWAYPFCMSMFISMSRLDVQSTCCASISMLHAHIHSECSCPCCMSMSMLHVHVNAEFPCQSCISVSMLYVKFHAAWTWTCSRNVNMHDGLGHAAWTWTWTWTRQGQRLRRGIY
jgi:hypothetical protein